MKSLQKRIGAAFFLLVVSCTTRAEPSPSPTNSAVPKEEQPKSGLVIEYTLDLGNSPTTSPEEILDKTIAIIEKRISNIPGATVSKEKNVTFRVFLPSLPPEDFEKTTKLIQRSGVLLFQRVEQPTDMVQTTCVPVGEPALTGEYVISASVEDNPDMGPSVRFQLNEEGSQKLLDFSKENLGQKVALSFDDKVMSCPVFRSEIPNGRGMITLGTISTRAEQLQEANSIAAALNAGALPVPLLKQSIYEFGADKPEP